MIVHAQRNILPPELAETLRRDGLLDLVNLISTLTPENAGAALDARRNFLEAQFGAPPDLRTEFDPFGSAHPHATTRYAPLESRDFSNALLDLLRARALGARDLNFHIPHECQYAAFRDEALANAFMEFVDRTGELLGITTLWENAPILDTTDWSIKTQTDAVPEQRRLCLDIGHLALGAESQAAALARIDEFYARHAAQIRHLHLHVNDLVHDQHNNNPAAVLEFLGVERFRRLTAGRTFIYERGA